MNVVELLARQATLRGAEPALVERRRILSFAELDQAASRWAAVLYASGLRPGDPVLFIHPMSAELYVALAAAFRLALTATFVDPSEGLGRIDACCAAHPPRGLIASPKGHGLRLLSRPLRRIPIKFSVGRALPGASTLKLTASSPLREAIEPVSPDAPALVTFTTGTTGEPKSVIRTHGFLMAQHRALERTLESAPGDLILTALPLFVLSNLASGAGSLLPDADLRRMGSIDPRPVQVQIDRHRPSGAIAPPAFWERLVENAERSGRGWASLRRIFTGGAPVYPELLDRLQRQAPEASAVAVYGSTEAEPMARIARDEISAEDRRAVLEGKGLLAGSPVAGLDLRIVPDGNGAPAGTGEIAVRGAHVLRASGADWHRTGDAGYLDGRGRLWLLGRCSARISDSRGVVYPLSVEGPALRHAAVRRAALASHLGRRILAVELREGLRAEEVREALRSLAVDDVLVLDRLPVDARHHSKIDYAALARLLERAP